VSFLWVWKEHHDVDGSSGDKFIAASSLQHLKMSGFQIQLLTYMNNCANEYYAVWRLIIS
jgi:hypothetical protein